MHEIYGNITRWIGAMIGALFAALVEPSLPYLIICTVAVFYDMFTAWQLDKRVAKQYPDKVDKETGLFSSKKAGKIVMTLIKVYAFIILAHFIHIHISGDLGILDVEKLAAGAVTFWQLISCLENESSCNDAKWAKVLQNVLIDKTERHFDINLSAMKPTKRKKRKTNTEGIE